MARKDIVQRLRGIIERTGRDLVDRTAVTEQDTIASLGIDSLAMLDFLYDVQQEFRIEFEPQELVAVKTLGELATFVEQRLAA
ncbi:MAG: acyl carrier protein [Planctomycetes bacterium]|nr:acyl carrier protein [Planctomycetota bacterium]